MPNKLHIVLILVLGYVILNAQTSSIPTTGWVTGQGYITAVPSGLITLKVSGTCPIGWTEVSALNGKMLRGTIAANGDVGTTGGNTTITPVGTINVQTFTGTSNITTSATSAGTPAGTNAVTATSGNCAATNIAAGTGSTTACKATAPNLTVPAETFTGSALATHTHTLTPAGTISQATFTGNSIDPSPSYTKVIFCSAN
ncbi:MAG TPA: hypothetical protein VNZ45_05665 [Bacteroidia bacterium]|jgi:hypothetical protein|nr:hypothetical protein [Bacteroidia bacterium]